jgi:hypothetical protein
VARFWPSSGLRGNKVRPRTAALDTESHSYLPCGDRTSPFALVKTRLSDRGLRLSNANAGAGGARNRAISTKVRSVREVMTLFRGKIDSATQSAQRLLAPSSPTTVQLAVIRHSAVLVHAIDGRTARLKRCRLVESYGLPKRH